MMLHVTLEGGQWPATGCGEWFNRNLTGAINVFHVLYHEFFDRGLRYFLPGARIEFTDTEVSRTTLDLVTRTDGKLALSWFGRDYVLEHPRGAFTENEIRIIVAVGNVLRRTIRQFLQHQHRCRHAGSIPRASRRIATFRRSSIPSPISAKARLPPARTTSPTPSRCCVKVRCSPSRTAASRPGRLLFGAGSEAPRRTVPQAPEVSPEAIPYTSQLTSIKSFHRLCDGIHTLFLVNRGGLLVDLVDVRDWTCMFNEADLPAPTANLYRAHCLATLQGGHICMVLTPNGEIKVMAHGIAGLQFSRRPLASHRLRT